jgi:hypothetical protein
MSESLKERRRRRVVRTSDHRGLFVLFRSIVHSVLLVRKSSVDRYSAHSKAILDD